MNDKPLWFSKYKNILFLTTIFGSITVLSVIISLLIHPDWIGFWISLFFGVFGLVQIFRSYLRIMNTEKSMNRLIGSATFLKEETVIESSYDKKGKLTKVQLFEFAINNFNFKIMVNGVSIYDSPTGYYAICEPHPLTNKVNLRVFGPK